MNNTMMYNVTYMSQKKYIYQHISNINISSYVSNPTGCTMSEGVITFHQIFRAFWSSFQDMQKVLCAVSVLVWLEHSRMSNRTVSWEDKHHSHEYSSFPLFSLSCSCWAWQHRVWNLPLISLGPTPSLFAYKYTSFRLFVEKQLQFSLFWI